jgi:hypothetical protein
MKKDDIYIPIELEHLMTFLFGKRSTHGLAGSHSIGTWKRNVQRITRAIRHAMYVNVDSGDLFHRKLLLGLCEQAGRDIGRAETKDEVNLLTIRYLVHLVFHLMGDMPDHWGRRVVNRSRDWRLDDNRKLIYAQTAEQKTRLIWSLPETQEFKGIIPTKLALWLKFRRDCGSDPNKFIEWFRREYQPVYLEVF